MAVPAFRSQQQQPSLKRKSNAVADVGPNGKRAGKARASDGSNGRAEQPNRKPSEAPPHPSSLLNLDTISPLHQRIIIALDIDAFYVSASRLRDPALHGLPIGIKQKGILATVSYEGRAKGVRKLASIREALGLCPELVLVNGEDLSWFRKLSSAIFTLVRRVVWGGKVEKLGMDELFCDVTDMVDAHLVQRMAEQTASGSSGTSVSFFDLRQPSHSSRTPSLAGDVSGTDVDSHNGFWYVAEPDRVPGHVLPSPASNSRQGLGLSSALQQAEDLYATRLRIGTHLALHLRDMIEREVGLTLSAGVAHCKMAAKMVGAINKPNKQTLWLPVAPAAQSAAAGRGLGRRDEVEREAEARDALLRAFLDPLDIRKVNSFGSAIVQTLEDDIAGKKRVNPNVAVRDSGTVRQAEQRVEGQRPWDAPSDERPLTVSLVCSYFDAASFDVLFGERLGQRLWALLQGRDDEPVVPAPEFPAQIGVEDTFPRGGIAGDEVVRQVQTLALSLLRRLEVELLEDEEEVEEDHKSGIAGIKRLKEQRFICKSEVIHEQGFNGIVKTYHEIEDEEEEETEKETEEATKVSHIKPKVKWKRYPTNLRLSIRQGWKNRTSKQGKVPVGIFDRSISDSPCEKSAKARSRQERAQLIAQTCMAMFRAMVANGTISTSNGARGTASAAAVATRLGGDVNSINLINITAFDLSKRKPSRSIGTLLGASGAKNRTRPNASASSAASVAKDTVGEGTLDDKAVVDVHVFLRLPPDLQAEIMQSTSLDGAQRAALRKAISQPVAESSAAAASLGHGPGAEQIQLASHSASFVEPLAPFQTRKAPATGSSATIVCPTCGMEMLVFMQHDHDRWPATGLDLDPLPGLDGAPGLDAGGAAPFDAASVGPGEESQLDLHFLDGAEGNGYW
ncbi:DNA/RNA polymerase [Tilletiaria anomala UBC 951]|uniref:DNA/RNA polymerase n=1 Tax=Tilletiaria anomala (strain ATCC 24038 / CBS 436.72 / UBC 951) TaxID=1037660 RepID=A0A066W6A7_TILAU|nr:DNA/RNA polymerase [Tilletiaria anomala UBC 951]KDN46619.1 DNA/RNA polymerase [Tilletiaria anomala UBC 951]